MIRILIADDQAVFRRGLRALIDDEPDLGLVGEAEDGVQAVALAIRRRADVVLMDIRMPRMNGLEATRRLAAADAPGRVDVIVLTTFDLDEYVFGALRAGAAGFLLKDAPAQDILDAIRVVGQGHGIIAPQVTRRLIARFAAISPNPERAPLLASLSAREEEVLTLIVRGESNAVIANELGIEEATIKSHVTRLMAKLGVRSRVQAVILAYETGFTTPGQPHR